MQALKGPGGRTIHYADTGEAGFRPVLFVGGTGTSACAFGMTEFLKSMRVQLKLRLITVERNGFGDTALTPGWAGCAGRMDGRPVAGVRGAAGVTGESGEILVSTLLLWP